MEPNNNSDLRNNSDLNNGRYNRSYTTIFLIAFAIIFLGNVEYMLVSLLSDDGLNSSEKTVSQNPNAGLVDENIIYEGTYNDCSENVIAYGKHLGEVRMTIKNKVTPLNSITASSAKVVLNATDAFYINGFNIMNYQQSLFHGNMGIKETSLINNMKVIEKNEKENNCNLIAQFQHVSTVDDILENSFYSNNSKAIRLRGNSNVTSSEDGFMGFIKSSNCRFCLKLQLKKFDLSMIRNKIVNYTLMCNLKVLIEMKLVSSQIKFSEERGTIGKISLISLIIDAIIDATEAVFALAMGISGQFMFSSFAIISIFKLMKLSMLNTRFIILVWKAKYNARLRNLSFTQVRHELLVLYRDFYVLLVFSVIIIFYLAPLFPFILVPLYFFILPQIICDLIKGQRNSLNLNYIIGNSICKLILPIYIWGFSSMFDGVIFPLIPYAPDYYLCASLIIIIFLQLIIYILQFRYGPRFFVPVGWLPNSYNYYRLRKTIFTTQIELPSHIHKECTICMNDITERDMNNVLFTPCDHIFHDKCLPKWLDIKMECPVCRTPLPPLD